MRRFFIDQDSISGENAILSDQEARHISTVLRLKPGNTIELFDGTGLVYRAEITDISKSSIRTRIIESLLCPERPPFLNMAQALVKGKKMDLIIQKATELGVSSFQPVITRHCDSKTMAKAQIERWQRIALEACKQCLRPTPMVCHPAISIDELLARTDDSTTNVMFWENQTAGALDKQQLTPKRNRALILIGPEGGFAEAEVHSAIQHGFTPATLGPRILRAETAAIAAISIIQFLLGNLCKPQTSVE